jgi:hypothetical protein
MVYCKTNTLKEWNACLGLMNQLEGKQPLQLEKEGKGAWLVYKNEIYWNQSGDLSKYPIMSNATLIKVVKMTKDLIVHNAGEETLHPSLGLNIGRLAFLKEIEGKDLSSWKPSFFSRLCAVLQRCWNWLWYREFKTATEIAQGYARSLLKCHEYSPALQSDVLSCIENPYHEVKSIKEISEESQKILEPLLQGIKNNTDKHFGAWLLTGKSLADTIILVNENKSVNFVGVVILKQTQKNHLKKLEALTQSNAWEHLREHTTHPDSGFDWWMFPTNRSSVAYGPLYQMGVKDIKILKQDPEFLTSYRAGVILVTKAWGWDLELGKDISNDKQKWTNYQVRLGKMVHSLVLFDQKDLLEGLRNFVKTKNVVLEPWIHKLLFSVTSK